MQVLCVEDVANHDDPESGVGIRKEAGEALTGEQAGRVLSRRQEALGQSRILEPQLRSLSSSHRLV